MSVLYVVSDQRGAGKTAFCAALAAELDRQGKRTAVLKPLKTGDRPDRDVEVFQDLLGKAHVGESLPAVDSPLTVDVLDQIKALSDETMEGHDVLLVEGPSNISEQDSRQIIETLAARVVLVVKFRPDLEASRLATWREAFGEQLLGVVVNGLTRYQNADAINELLPSIRSQGLIPLGLIPEDRRLLGVTVGQLASHLEGRFVLGDDSIDGLVEHFLVGGLGLDSGALYFGLRENKAVIVRGDRPDIQMAALQTPVTCMVLTQGVEPIEYVSYEAELEEVPVIVVESDTLTTMASLNTLQDAVRFDHPAKLERMSKLMREHVDLPAIHAGLGFAA